MTYSTDFRRKVMAIKEQENMTHAETVERFGMGVADVTRWRRCAVGWRWPC